MRPLVRASVAAGVLSASVAAGCSVRFSWPRHTLDVALSVSQDRMDDGPIALDALTMVVDSVELVACADSGDAQRQMQSSRSRRQADAIHVCAQVVTDRSFESVELRPQRGNKV